MDWFEQAWEEREERLYLRLFGQSEPKIRVLTFELFRDRFGQTTVDPRWLHHGVLVFPPNDRDAHFRYVTSGMSNAWEDENPHSEGVSGLGVEYILTTSSFHEWAMGVTLNMLAFQLLLAAGRLGKAALVGMHDRVPLRAPIDGKQSALTHILFAGAPGLGESEHLPSGRFEFLQLIGISDAEATYARKHGGDALVALLQERGGYPLTDAARASVV